MRNVKIRKPRLKAAACRVTNRAEFHDSPDRRLALSTPRASDRAHAVIDMRPRLEDAASGLPGWRAQRLYMTDDKQPRLVRAVSRQGFT